METARLALVLWSGWAIVVAVPLGYWRVLRRTRVRHSHYLTRLATILPLIL